MWATKIDVSRALDVLGKHGPVIMRACDQSVLNILDQASYHQRPNVHSFHVEVKGDTSAHLSVVRGILNCDTFGIPRPIDPKFFEIILEVNHLLRDEKSRGIFFFHGINNDLPRSLLDDVFGVFRGLGNDVISCAAFVPKGPLYTGKWFDVSEDANIYEVCNRIIAKF